MGDLKENDFVVNPYDPCVCSKTVDGKHMTITWHVDDIKISHHTNAAITDIVTYLEKIDDTLTAS